MLLRRTKKQQVTMTVMRRNILGFPAFFRGGGTFFCCAAAKTLRYYCGATSLAMLLPFLGVSSLNLAAPLGAAFLFGSRLAALAPHHDDASLASS
jgi:hypothetical protein